MPLINIYATDSYYTCSRSPRGERGLKPLAVFALFAMSGRSPRGERGLKLSMDLLTTEVPSRSPRGERGLKHF